MGRGYAGSPDRIRYYEEQYDAILRPGEIENPVSVNPEQKKKRGRPKKTKSQNFIERFKTHKGGILLFMKDFRVPFTNNQAERDVRTKFSKKFQEHSGVCKEQTTSAGFVDTYQLSRKIMYQYSNQ